MYRQWNIYSLILHKYYANRQSQWKFKKKTLIRGCNLSLILRRYRKFAAFSMYVHLSTNLQLMFYSWNLHRTHCVLSSITMMSYKLNDPRLSNNSSKIQAFHFRFVFPNFHFSFSLKWTMTSYGSHLFIEDFLVESS